MPGTHQSAHSQTSGGQVLDQTFFFQDVYILVENTSFRVWRRNFEQGSSVFRDMFSLPRGSSASEGSSQDHPIVLQGVTASDFRQLLRVMFPCTTDKEDVLTTDGWIAVLKLSTMWEFARIRKAAITKLENLLKSHASRRLALARQYDIHPWLVPALNELAQRSEPLIKADFDVIGLDDFLKLAQVREQYTSCTNCSQQSCGRSDTPPRTWAHLAATSRSDFGSRSSSSFGLSVDPVPTASGRAGYDFSRHITRIFGL